MANFVKQRWTSLAAGSVLLIFLFYQYRKTNDFASEEAVPRTSLSFQGIKEEISNRQTTPTYNIPHTPVQHIAFIKTHKCAGSTIQNIIMRYAIANNLTFLLPKGSGNHVGWPKPFDPPKHMRSLAKAPDVLCYHSVYSSKIADVMPANTFYLTSVRDPFTQIISSYSYYNYFNRTGKPLSAILAAASVKQFVDIIPIHNPMMYDLGYPMNAMLNYTKVDEYINMLDRRFNLVIVVEYFDECLIVLRDMLGWRNADVLSFVTNLRKQNDTKSSRSPGMDLNDTESNRAMLYEVMKADNKLYTHFKKKMERLISLNKEYIEREVNELRKLRDNWFKYCIDSIVSANQMTNKIFKPYIAEASGYQLTEDGLQNQTCVNLARVELSFVTMIHEKFKL